MISLVPLPFVHQACIACSGTRVPKGNDYAPIKAKYTDVAIAILFDKSRHRNQVVADNSLYALALIGRTRWP